MSEKFTVQPGGMTAKLVNPFEKPIARHEITDWDKFEQHHPPLPILTENPMKEGEVIEGDVKDAVLKNNGKIEVYDVKPLYGINSLRWKEIKVCVPVQAISPIVKELPANNSQVENKKLSEEKVLQIMSMSRNGVWDWFTIDKDLEDGTLNECIEKRLPHRFINPNANKQAEAERQKIVAIVENRASRAFISSDFSEKYVYTALTRLLTQIKEIK